MSNAPGVSAAERMKQILMQNKKPERKLTDVARVTDHFCRLPAPGSAPEASTPSVDTAREFLLNYTGNPTTARGLNAAIDTATRQLRGKKVKEDLPLELRWWWWAILEPGIPDMQLRWQQYLATRGAKSNCVSQPELRITDARTATGVRPVWTQKPTEAQNAALMDLFKSEYYADAVRIGVIKEEQVPVAYRATVARGRQPRTPEALAALTADGRFGPWALLKGAVFVSAKGGCCYSGGDEQATVVYNVLASTDACVEKDSRTTSEIPEAWEITIMIPDDSDARHTVMWHNHKHDWNMDRKRMMTIYLRHNPTGQTAYFIPSVWEEEKEWSAQTLIDKLTDKALRGVPLKKDADRKDVTVIEIPSYIIREQLPATASDDGRGAKTQRPSITAINSGYFTTKRVREYGFDRRSWYNSSNAKELTTQLETWIARARLKLQPLPADNWRFHAIIVPHAGYKYSGETAAFAFARAVQQVEASRGRRFSCAVILAPLHYASGRFSTSCHLSAFDAISTPLGTIDVDTVLASQILRSNRTGYDRLSDERIDNKEHSLEMVLPFLFVAPPDVTSVVPLYVSELKDHDIDALAEPLATVLQTRDDVLFVVSSDFTHWGEHHRFPPKYRTADEIKATRSIADIDKRALTAICSADTKAFDQFEQSHGRMHSMCGATPVRLLMHAMDKAFGAHKWAGMIEDQSRSDGQSMTRSAAPENESTESVVSYAAVSLYSSR